MRRRLAALLCALAGSVPTAWGLEDNPDCPALALSAAFVSVQSHALRANPERSSFGAAPAMALQNANWASKMTVVFEALGRQARSESGRAAFSRAKVAMSMLAGAAVEAPPQGDPGRSCAAPPNDGPSVLNRQLTALAGAERQLRDAWVDACGGRP